MTFAPFPLVQILVVNLASVSAEERIKPGRKAGAGIAL